MLFRRGGLLIGARCRRNFTGLDRITTGINRRKKQTRFLVAWPWIAKIGLTEANALKYKRNLGFPAVLASENFTVPREGPGRFVPTPCYKKNKCIGNNYCLLTVDCTGLVPRYIKESMH